MRKYLLLASLLIVLWTCCKSDTVVPAVEITNPADSTVVSGTVNITVSATDNKGIARIDLFIDESLVVSFTAEPYNHSWVTSALADSSHHQITANAYDAAENEGISPVVSVMVDNSVPCSNILIWNFDPADRFYDSEALDTVDCAHGLEQALTDNGYDYLKVTDLPASLDSIDIIFATIGFKRTC